MSWWETTTFLLHLLVGCSALLFSYVLLSICIYFVSFNHVILFSFYFLSCPLTKKIVICIVIIGRDLIYKQFAEVSSRFLPSNNNPPLYILLLTEYIVKASCSLYVYVLLV